MKRFLSLFLILSFVSCSSYQSKVEKNKLDLDQVEQIVLDSDDIPAEEKKFVKDTITKAKKLLDKGISESALADKWREWVFDKWLFVSLFVLGIIGLIILKIKSFSCTSLIPSFSISKNGGQENAG
ncbi:putative lipoprotein [Leptospira weilii serovar Topaz str. LT2116]|uniref:Putative lipoprotein n=1 Tax=Leptospira weilii serovar Topaz str. LT2116 TaxID=1088540 RepID=M3G4L2_9LEPT|nr:putative lipoprotein [Leptospira weilii serovar Topaz str. LT2116]